MVADVEVEPDPGASADTEEHADLEEIDGVGPAYAERLREAGVGSVADLARADASALAGETGISPNRLEDWIEQARESTN